MNIQAVWGAETAPCCGEAVNLADRHGRALLRVLGYSVRQPHGQDNPHMFAGRVAGVRTRLDWSADPSSQGAEFLAVALGSQMRFWRSVLDKLDLVCAEAARRQGKVSWS